MAYPPPGTMTVAMTGPIIGHHLEPAIPEGPDRLLRISLKGDENLHAPVTELRESPPAKTSAEDRVDVLVP